MSQLFHIADTIKAIAAFGQKSQKVGIAATKGAAGIAAKYGYITDTKYIDGVKYIHDDGSGGW